MTDNFDTSKRFIAQNAVHELMRTHTALPEAPQAVHLPKHLTYAAVIDVRGAETEITDLMVRRACKEAEGLQRFPFGPKKSSA